MNSVGKFIGNYLNLIKKKGNGAIKPLTYICTLHIIPTVIKISLEKVISAHVEYLTWCIFHIP